MTTTSGFPSIGRTVPYDSSAPSPAPSTVISYKEAYPSLQLPKSYVAHDDGDESVHSSGTVP